MTCVRGLFAVCCFLRIIVAILFFALFAVLFACCSPHYCPQCFPPPPPAHEACAKPTRTTTPARSTAQKTNGLASTATTTRLSPAMSAPKGRPAMRVTASDTKPSRTPPPSRRPPPNGRPAMSVTASNTKPTRRPGWPSRRPSPGRLRGRTSRGRGGRRGGRGLPSGTVGPQ